MATTNKSGKSKANKTAPTVVEATLAATAPNLQTPVAATQADKAMQFAVQQMATPVADAPAATPAPQADAPAPVAEVKPAKPVPVPRTPLLVQNGMQKPGAGTIGCRMWDVMDNTARTLGRAPSIAELKALPDFANDLPVNVSSIYARWRKFNGVSGRVAAPVAPITTVLQAQQVPATYGNTGILICASYADMLTAVK